jgi:hypothetical protein
MDLIVLLIIRQSLEAELQVRKTTGINLIFEMLMKENIGCENQA